MLHCLASLCLQTQLWRLPWWWPSDFTIGIWLFSYVIWIKYRYSPDTYSVKSMGHFSHFWELSGSFLSFLSSPVRKVKLETGDCTYTSERDLQAQLTFLLNGCSDLWTISIYSCFQVVLKAGLILLKEKCIVMIFIKIPPFFGIVQTKEVSSICVHNNSGYANHLHLSR